MAGGGECPGLLSIAGMSSGFDSALIARLINLFLLSIDFKTGKKKPEHLAMPGFFNSS